MKKLIEKFESEYNRILEDENSCAEREELIEERYIGDVFELNGIILEVVELPGCTQCYFYGRCNQDQPNVGRCEGARRTDKKKCNFYWKKECKMKMKMFQNKQ